MKIQPTIGLLSLRPLIPLQKYSKKPAVSNFNSFYFGLGDKIPFKDMLDVATDVGIVLGKTKYSINRDGVPGSLFCFDCDTEEGRKKLLSVCPQLKDTAQVFRHHEKTHEILSHGHFYVYVDGMLPHRAACKIRNAKGEDVIDLKMASGYCKILGQNKHGITGNKDNPEHLSYYWTHKADQILVLDQAELLDIIDSLKERHGFETVGFFVRTACKDIIKTKQAALDCRLLPGPITNAIIDFEKPKTKRKEAILEKVIDDLMNDKSQPSLVYTPKVSPKTEMLQARRDGVATNVAEERKMNARFIRNMDVNKVEGRVSSAVTDPTQKINDIVLNYLSNKNNFDAATGLVKTNQLIFEVNRAIFNLGISQNHTQIFTDIFNNNLDAGKLTRHNLVSFLKEAAQNYSYIKPMGEFVGNDNKAARASNSIVVQIISAAVDKSELDLEKYDFKTRMYYAKKVLRNLFHKSEVFRKLTYFTRRDLEIAFAYRNSGFMDKLKVLLNKWMAEWKKETENKDKEKELTKTTTKNIALADCENNFVSYNRRNAFRAENPVENPFETFVYRLKRPRFDLINSGLGV